MVLPTMVPPSAFLSIGLLTTLTSDSLSRRRVRSFGFFTPGGAAWLVPLAFITPAEESVVLRSLGIWAAPMEVICLRLVAAPLWAGFQFYVISMVFPSLVPYHPVFRPRSGAISGFLFRCFAAPMLGNPGLPPWPAQNFSPQGALEPVFGPNQASGGVGAPPVHPKVHPQSSPSEFPSGGAAA